MKINIDVTAVESATVRARQLASMFDKPPQEKQHRHWTIDAPVDDQPWNLGLIVGPSGSGKTSILKEFGPPVHTEWSEPSVIDDFRSDLSMTDVADACSAVGFNTIPAWLRPYDTLSNGEQFRVGLARLLAEAEPGSTIVIDEFTSVVDRQVAKIASAALAKYARRRNIHVVVASCHYDVIDWLQPDWMIEPATEQFSQRSVGDRPKSSGASPPVMQRSGSGSLPITI